MLENAGAAVLTKLEDATLTTPIKMEAAVTLGGGMELHRYYTIGDALVADIRMREEMKD